VKKRKTKKRELKRTKKTKAPLPAQYLHLRPESYVIAESETPFRGGLLTKAQYEAALKGDSLSFTGAEETKHTFESDAGRTNHYYLVLDRGEVTVAYKVIREGFILEEGFVGANAT